MFYRVTLGNREFNAGAFYDNVDWTDLDAIVENFRHRVTWWYLDPADHLETGDRRFEFPVMALCCILIDSLSQFYYGTTQSSRTNFKNFVSLYIPEFAQNLPDTIQHKADTTNSAPKTLKTYAEVLYFAFRCGILHDAHIVPYGMVRAVGQLTQFHPSGFTSYGAGGDCPTVMIDAWFFRDRVKVVLQNYLDRLVDPDPNNDVLRDNFKFKFTESFGVDIMNSQ